MNNCPICGGRLYEDAAETITEKNGNFVIDAFPAYVCDRKCGYVERLDLTDRNG